MSTRGDATIQAWSAHQQQQHDASRQEDARDRAALTMSRMDEALATLRSRSPQPRPDSAGAAVASHPGDDHEYR